MIEDGKEIVNAVLLMPRPVKQPDRLVKVLNPKPRSLNPSTAVE
ncbi:MAG: hypothetical protein AABN33_15640 [Acidobacteriota bacterium]